MITIELQDVYMHAFHGIYEGEEKIGNPYIINLTVKYDERLTDLEDINNTINYVDLYDIVKKRMMIPTGLLEKVCDGIIRHIKHQYPFITEASLSIYKIQPTITEFQGRVGVSMNKKFND